jgi:hypothetical protein
MADKANDLLRQNIELTKGVQKANADLAGQLNASIKVYSDLLTKQTELNKQLKNATSAKTQAAAQRDLTNNIKATSLAEKELIKQEVELEKLKRQKLQTAQKEAQAAERVKRATDKLNSAYKKESARLTELRNKAKDVGIQFGVTSKKFKEAAREVNKLDAQLKKVDSALGQNQRSVGNYSRALGGLKNLLGAAGVAGGAAAFFNILKNGIKISKEYEKSNAELAGVLGKQLDETVKLQNESKRLGATTAFTSSQVTELQISLARLGKTEQEIIDSTEGIIDATIALGSETGETATLVGATLNAFQLEAKESGKVADILTLSTQKSALSFQKLNTALPIVAGSAKAAGVSLERMVAQLGQAADRGIDASTSASALRNIYIELETSGLSMDEALGLINNSTNKVATAFDLFGKKGISTALALAGTQDKTESLTKALENSGGTAKRVADTQLNTLDGRIKILNSAYEGLILNVFNTNGAFGDFSNTVLILTTALLSGINSLFGTADALDEVGTAIKNVTDLYEDEEELLQDSDVARKQLIESLEQEGLSYSEAKKEADKYLKTLEAIAGGVFERGNIEILKNEIALIKESGDAFGLLFEKEKELKNLEDALYFSKIKLAEATNEELQGYLKIENQLLQLNNAQERFVDDVRVEIEARSANVESINKEISAKEKLAKTKEVPDQIKADLKLDATKEDPLFDIEADNDREIALYLKKEDAKTKALEDAEKERAELRRLWANVGFEAAEAIANVAFENANTRREQEANAEILAMQTALDNQVLDDDVREAKQKEITQREKELRKQNAIAQKKDAMFQAAINTALGIGQAIAAAPPPVNIPLIALQAAAGAVQVGLIAARPIPQFDKGTKSAPKGGFIAGEKGFELMEHNGKTELITTPTLFGDNYAGAEITSTKDTAKRINNAVNGDVINLDLNKRDHQIALAVEQAMIKQGDKFEKHSKSMIAELKKNRPQDMSGLDRMKLTNETMAKFAE